MISFAERGILLLLFSLVALCGNGKEIVSYKLIQTTDPGVKAGAIQFVSFVGDQCYESSVTGQSVNNGTMHKNVYQSSGEKSVYVGVCFCGGGSKFEFNSDKSLLTVTSKSKHIYSFKQIPHPQGVTTCSLIRKRGQGGNSLEYNAGGVVNDGYYPNSGGVSGSQNSDNSISDKNADKVTRNQKRCAYCKGAGQLTRDDNAPSNFGVEKPRRQCSSCGKWYNPNVFNHYHISCRHCGGTGIAR